MVQRNGFRVTLKKPTGEQFPEVQDPRTGDVYVVASPGELFHIHYEVLPERQLPRSHGLATYRFRTLVDNKCIGMNYLTSRDTKAEGFVRQGDTVSATYDLFKFAEAASDASNMAQSLAFNEGRIKVTVEEVEVAGQASKGYAVSNASHRAAAVASLPEGKKFFNAPSLTTASGGTVTGQGFSTMRHTAVSGDLATFDIRYETPSTLLLRKVLERNNPDHAAILDSFEETRYRPPPAEVEIKQERPRVKRQRGPPEVIDLSGRMPPLPAAERLAPGEELVCDLTGVDSDGEGEGPRWTKRRVAPEYEEIASTQAE